VSSKRIDVFICRLLGKINYSYNLKKGEAVEEVSSMHIYTRNDAEVERKSTFLSMSWNKKRKNIKFFFVSHVI
jgi:hypothetical protein